MALFSVVLKGQTRTDELILNQEFEAEQKEKLPDKADLQWIRFPLEVVGHPSLEVLKQRLDGHLAAMLIL